MPATASPSFHFAALDALAPLSATAGATVTATLDSLQGVSLVEWSVVSTDDTTEAADYTLTTSGPKGSICTFDAGVEGTALILQCRVNAGVNPATSAVDAAMTARAKCYVATSSGYEVFCFNEQFEAGPTGWLPALNAVVRAAGGAGATATTGTELDGAHTVPGSLETFDVADARWIAVGSTLLFGDAGDPFFIGEVDSVPTRAAPGQVTVSALTLLQAEGTTMPDGTPVTLSGVRGAAGADGNDGNDGNDGDPGAAGPAGRVYADSSTETADFTAVAGEHHTIDLGGGTELSVALPATTGIDNGTEIALTLADCGPGAIVELTAATGETIHNDGVSDQVFRMGEYFNDYAIRLVKRSGGWNRADRSIGATYSAGVLNTGGAYVTGVPIVVGGFGGATLVAHSGVLSITATEGVIVVTGAVYHTPQAAPDAPDDGGAMWFDSTLNKFCVMGPDGNTYTIDTTLVPP